MASAVRGTGVAEAAGVLGGAAAGIGSRQADTSTMTASSLAPVPSQQPSRQSRPTVNQAPQRRS